MISCMWSGPCEKASWQMIDRINPNTCSRSPTSEYQGSTSTEIILGRL